MAQLPQSKYEFRVIYSDIYSTVTYNEELAIAICTSDSEYIPIVDFKKLFLSVSEFTETSKVHSFVFDKSNLRTFSQPSMEWYYTIWKPKMKMKGLVNQYKVLPELDWFRKAVEAGKYEIFHKYGKDILTGINIYYINSVQELLTQLEKDKEYTPA